jgi:hypothetical protein
MEAAEQPTKERKVYVIWRAVNQGNLDAARLVTIRSTELTAAVIVIEKNRENNGLYFYTQEQLIEE